jgi:LuxR family maltose regulon positive regulatory protein
MAATMPEPSRARRSAATLRALAGRELPVLRDGLVPRPRLVRRLMQAADTPVALVAAPAGWGKSTLIAQWARRERRHFACLTLDVADNDPGLLMAEVTHAVEGHEAFVLVLDDVHVLTAPEALASLRALAERIPRGSQLVLASRSEPSLPVGRLRAHRSLVEVRSRDLGMTVPEAAALFSAAGLDLSRGDVEMLVRRTGGWPAILYLASVALRECSDPAAAARGFGGDDLLVSDYVRDEFLSRLEPGEAELLVRTSLLDELSGSLCDAVLARRGSARVLDKLGRRDLVLAPVDRGGETYHCDPLLAEALRGELRRLEPELEPALHRRASDWHHARGDLDRAIDHAIAADDVARAGDLLAAHALEYVGQGRRDAVARWLGCFTRDQVAGHPGLALAAASCALAGGDAEGAAACAAAADDQGATIIGAALAVDGVRRMGIDADRAYRGEPEDSPWRGVCCLLAGVSDHLTGDRDSARLHLEEGVRRAAVAAPSVQTLCLAQLALVASEREDWEDGAVFAARAIAQVEHYGLAGYPTSALVFAASAAVRAHRGRVEEAQEDLRRARELLGDLGDFVPWYDAETRVTLARAALRLSDVAGARELLAGAARSAARTPEAVVLRKWLAEVETQAAAMAASPTLGPALLTTAELRILCFLPTHLSFREIASQLFVSANTVKTQAHAVYRKLDASSRSEAVARATALGLLDA